MPEGQQAQHLALTLGQRVSLGRGPLFGVGRNHRERLASDGRSGSPAAISRTAETTSSSAASLRRNRWRRRRKPRARSSDRLPSRARAPWSPGTPSSSSGRRRDPALTRHDDIQQHDVRLQCPRSKDRVAWRCRPRRPPPGRPGRRARAGAPNGRRRDRRPSTIVDHSGTSDHESRALSRRVRIRSSAALVQLDPLAHAHECPGRLRVLSGSKPCPSSSITSVARSFGRGRAGC